MAKEKEQKITLEREYTIPLRKGWLKVPEYKRANKTITVIREFVLRHMKVYDRDPEKVKISIMLNNEIRFRGMKKPPAKIKIKAKKFEDDTVVVELAEIPKILQYKIEKDKKLKEKAEKTKAKKKEEKKEDKPAEEETKEKEEKKEATKEAGLKAAEQQAKQAKHLTSTKETVKPHRMALQK